VRADRALECLGDLLRYALGAGEEVVFSQEWRFTQDFVAFEQIRLGERLRVDADIDPAALAAMVPPLILQPLVENAVRHGIADRPEGGRIEVRARIDAGRLLLRVSDDGRGRHGRLEDGLGLGSIRRRLHAHYGDRSSLDIDTGAAGFAVTIQLPIDTADGLGSIA
jgi:sensor histidine kinase YesM